MTPTKRNSPLFALLLVLFMGALVWFFSQMQRWYLFSQQVLLHASQIAPLQKQDMLLATTPVPVHADREVKYRTFFLTSPGAEKVELQGDFNRWGKDPLELTPYKKGYFETSVALASGEYRYEYVVDGVAQPDPANQDRRILPDGREVCVRTVR